MAAKTATKKAMKKATQKSTKTASKKTASTKTASTKRASTKTASTKTATTKTATKGTNATTSADVDRWFATVCPPPFRATLTALRQQIAALAPTATECISYQLPSFRYADHGLVAYGFGKAHCSFYPMSSTVLDHVKPALAGLKTSTGTVRFSPDQPLPASLVATIVQLRLAENDAAQARRR